MKHEISHPYPKTWRTYNKLTLLNSPQGHHATPPCLNFDNLPTISTISFLQNPSDHGKLLSNQSATYQTHFLPTTPLEQKFFETIPLIKTQMDSAAPKGHRLTLKDKENAFLLDCE